MPRTKKSTARSVAAAVLGVNGAEGEVLSLPEAAAYLRLAEPDVLRLVDEQGLPGRRLGQEWRFLKGAIRAWLGTPLTPSKKQGIWAAAGALQDDPNLEEMLFQLDRLRGRSQR